jgi:hypothetical protein
MESVGGSGQTGWGASDISTGVLGFGFDTTKNPKKVWSTGAAPFMPAVEARATTI